MRFVEQTTISGLSLVFVSSGHTAGLGTLTAVTSGTVSWKAPGSATAGTAVAVSNGGQAILKDGANSALYVVVARTSAANLSGTSTVLVSVGNSASEMLVAVEAAILECLQAEGEGHGDASIRRATLDSLRNFRAELKREITSETAGAGIGYADFSGGQS